MAARLTTLIKKIFKKASKKNEHGDSIILGLGSIDNGIRVRVRGNVTNNSNHSSRQPAHSLIVGEDSIVAGNFTFEDGLGQVFVGDRTFIGGGDFICKEKIQIGSDVLISWGCTIIDTNSHSTDFELRKDDVLDWKRGIVEGSPGYYKNWNHVDSRPVIIKDKVWIGLKSIILKGVTIGEGAIVGSGSLVSSDVPDWTIVAGNPAKIIRKLK